MTTELVLVALVLVAPLAWLAMTRRWQLTLFGIMVLMIFEGAIRKWLLPEFQTQIYLLKDALLLVAFYGFLRSPAPYGVHEPLLKGLKVAFAITAAYCFFEIANPNSPSPIVGLVGFKNYMLYWAILFMVPYAFTSPRDVERKIKIYMALMIPVAVLGLMQFFSPPDSWINSYVNRGEEVQSVARMGQSGAFARSSGTFSYIGGFATFVFAVFFLSLSTVIANYRDLRSNYVGSALLIASTLAMFTTGSRTVVFGILGFVPIALFLCMRARLITPKILVQLTIATAITAGLASVYASEAVDAFTYRANNADSSTMRALTPFTEAMHAFETTPPFGMGIGVTHGSAASLTGDPKYTWLHGNMHEMETARVLQEVGLIGFVLIYAVRIYLFFLAVSMTRRLQTPLFKSLSAAIAVYFLMHIFMFVINNPTAGLFYWFGAGLLFAMYRLEREPGTVSTVRSANQGAGRGRLQPIWQTSARGSKPHNAHSARKQKFIP